MINKRINLGEYIIVVKYNPENSDLIVHVQYEDGENIESIIINNDEDIDGENIESIIINNDEDIDDENLGDSGPDEDSDGGIKIYLNE
jgi:hypothetical protein